jgi:diaminopimelate epimerase
VIFCESVGGVPLASIGSFLERQPIFPNRINVHFASIVSRNEATMRTWERGAGATMACGTGACAVAVAGARTGRLDREVLLHLPGGDLRIEWDAETNHVRMTGPATDVFEGEYEPGA